MEFLAVAEHFRSEGAARRAVGVQSTTKARLEGEWPAHTASRMSSNEEVWNAEPLAAILCLCRPSGLPQLSEKISGEPQRDEWRSCTSSKVASSVEQRSKATGPRGAKRHPWEGIASRILVLGAAHLVDHHRSGRYEQLRVGVGGPVGYFASGTLLDGGSRGHDHDPVGEVADDGEGVADEQHGHGPLADDLERQVEDLNLDRDVQR